MSPTAKHLPDAGKTPDHSASAMRDVSGYDFFSSGASAALHAVAHRMLDSGRIRAGHRALGNWLSGKTGHGSEWVHLHFHMAVFELALGDRHSAYCRFMTQVLPAAASSTDALTDAPARLWRFQCSTPEPLKLPWRPLLRTALSAMRHTTDPFIQVHNLLALAGAGGSPGINRWLQSGAGVNRSNSGWLVEQIAAALSSLASRSFVRASGMLKETLPDIQLLGGSHAQGLLFAQLANWSCRRAETASRGQGYASAA